MFGGRAYRSRGRLRALLASTALAGSVAISAAADDFWSIPGAIGDSVYLSADGSTLVFSPYNGGGAYIWTGTGLAQIAGAQSAYGVSADGAVIVGSLNGKFGVWRGSAFTEFDPLVLNRNYGTVTGLSADGRFAIGNMPTLSGVGNDRAPVIWDTATGEIEDIGDSPGGLNYGWATNISADGSVVVGYNTTSSGWQVFRWEKDVGRFDLPDTFAQNLLLSGNGQVITPTDGAWRWIGDSTGTKLENIDYLPGASYQRLNAISYDGSTVVGYAFTGTAYRAFRWIDGVGSDLGALEGSLEASALAMSADGSIVVGYSRVGISKQAVRWGEYGIAKISDLLTRGGVDIAGWNLQEAQKISDDGTIIVGVGTDSSSQYGVWVTHCATVCAIITPDTAAQSLAGLGALGATAGAYVGTQSDTAADLARPGPAGSISGFAYGAFDSDPTTSATVGATYAFGNDLVMAGSIGLAGIETLLPFDGTALFTGPSATLTLSSKPASGLNWMVGGSLIALSGTVNRGYLNGNTPVISTGTTTGSAAGFTGEIGWTFDDLIADTLVTPFVNVTVTSASFAGYTETSGPFPATLSGFTTSSTLLRAGIEARHEVQPGTQVTAGFSYGHNFGNGGAIAGSITGMNLSVPGAAPAADFVEASIGLDMPLTETIGFSGRLAAVLPFGGAPSVQARAGVRMSF